MAATAIKWEAPATIQTYLSTDLNSLADAGTFLGAKIDNVLDGENVMFMGLELYVAAQGVARDSGANVAVYLLPTIDDTNFSYGDSAALVDGGNLLTVFALDAATTARYVCRANLRVPPFDFKLQLANNTGQAFAATLNTLKYRLYSLESQ